MRPAKTGGPGPVKAHVGTDDEQPVQATSSIEERYYVVSTTGGLVNPAAGIGSGSRRTTSYSILDRFWAHREVRQLYARGAGNAPGARRAAQAHAECARLNADEAEWERQGESTA